jgi:hypothetical protein
VAEQFSENPTQSLMDAFFHARDQQLLAEFRQRLEKKDRREQLAAVSGVQDEATLDRLIELNISPEELAAIHVIPLVQVAWADGNVKPEERAAIIQAARDAGIQSRDGHFPLLEHWLNDHPGREMLEAWKYYIQSLCKQLRPEEIAKLKTDTLTLAQKIAEAAGGGLMGLRSKISKAERAMLDELAKAFG